MSRIILFYKYIPLVDPESIRIVQRLWCEELSLKGRLFLASEGINGTLEGSELAITEYIGRMNESSDFQEINYKFSKGNGTSFPKLQVKVRTEIVAMHIEDRDLGPLGGVTGEYIEAKELQEWYEQEKDFVVIDMRNCYEYEVGRFRNSVYSPGLRNFRDLPTILPDIEHLKNKTVVAVCTGGVRCEKASGFLKKHGFETVYQLHNGIHTYMEQFPNQYFDGKLYVFDKRKLWAPEKAPEPQTIARCILCQELSENVLDWYDKDSQKRNQGVICEACIKKGLVIPDIKGTHFTLKD